MENKVLRSFIAAATLKNFSAAARELNMAQPAISRHVSDLERELGVPLLKRTTREVEVTKAGAYLLQEAIKILAHNQEIKQRVLRVSAGETGTLKIGYLASAGASFIPHLVNSYTARYPNVHISLFVMSSHAILEALIRKEIDVGFSRPLPLPEQAHFTSEELYVDTLMAVLPNSHALADRKIIELNQLKTERFILYSDNMTSSLVIQVQHACQKEGFTPTIISKPVNMQAVLTEIAANLGVSVMPGCVRRLYTEGCLFKPLRGQTPSFPLELHYQRDLANPTIEAFVNITLAAKPKIKQDIVI